jgi:hypothetical protein
LKFSRLARLFCYAYDYFYPFFFYLPPAPDFNEVGGSLLVSLDSLRDISSSDGFSSISLGALGAINNFLICLAFLFF